MIKILCISNLYEMTDTTWNGIEIGKTYDAVKENKNSYFIERRIGVLYKYPKHLFILLSEYRNQQINSILNE